MKIDQFAALGVTVIAAIVLAVPASTLGGEAAPPRGYPSRDAVLQAIRLGELKLINPLIPAPETIQVKKDVQYGTGGDRALKLDLYQPRSLDRPVPRLVFIHGGAWSGDKHYTRHGHGGGRQPLLPDRNTGVS